MQNAEPDLMGINPARLRTFVIDQDNLRSALDWALAADDPQPAAELLWRWACVCFYRGRPREVEEWAPRAVAQRNAPIGRR